MAWLDGWSKRIKLELDHTRVDDNLVDFPIYITLASGVGRNNFDATDIFDELTDIITTASGYLDPSYKSSSLTLSNSNMTVEHTGSTGWGMVRSDIGWDAGKWYWEVTIDVHNGPYGLIGAVPQSQATNNYPGQIDHSYGYSAFDGNRFSGGSNTTYGASYTAGDIIGVALDLDNGRIWFSKNGVWQNSGNPSLGTNAAFDNTTDATYIFGKLYACVAPYQNGDQFTVNFGESPFQYSVPTGFSAGFYDITYTDNKYKIAVTTDDGETQCPVEIEAWSWVGRRADLWTKVPNISSSIDTTLYLYYDVSQLDNTINVGETDTTPAQSVWDSNYGFVVHLHEAPGAGANRDSTGNGWSFSAGGSMLPDDSTYSLVGKGLDFDGSNDYLVSQTGPQILDATEFTMETIFRADHLRISSYDSYIFWSRGDTTTTPAVVMLINKDSDHLRVGGRIGQSGDSTIYTISSVTLYPDIWYYGATKWKSEETLDSWTNATKTIGSTISGTVYEGTTLDWEVGNANGISNHEFDGVITELRYSTISRSDAWIKATYYTTFDDLIVYSELQNIPIYYYHGYIRERGVPVARTVRLYYRTTGELMDETTSSGNGYYYLTTSISGEHFVVAFDDDLGESFNAVILDKLPPLGID